MAANDQPAQLTPKQKLWFQAFVDRVSREFWSELARREEARLDKLLAGRLYTRGISDGR